jgi:hypothetical protein
MQWRCATASRPLGMLCRGSPASKASKSLTDTDGTAAPVDGQHPIKMKNKPIEHPIIIPLYYSWLVVTGTMEFKNFPFSWE